ncbi:cell division protein FtsL [Hydrogenothermus marinus]|uniref:Cell division protein FtsL n=1 Tax=Hydrogenothermus marinus TaxID=133270 RepID=A0A3M0BMF8_9AQUI|nr:cell division protein FtsL [Hydrogenothermus marinus]RMA96018.1 cell division protein FtsL [Hydrogenothermus marinus]
MIKDLVLDLKSDYKIIKKQIKYLLLIVLIAIPLIIYNNDFLKLEEDITKLSSEKSYLQTKNIKLKEKISILSSPKRISYIAKKKLKMKKVDLSKVKFLDSK